MTKQRRKLVHFLALDTRDPLCGGEGKGESGAAVNGVAVCATCARKVSEQLGDVLELPVLRPPGRT